MQFQDYIKPELLILIPVLNIVGVCLKKSCIKNKYIPILLGSASILLCGLYIAATSESYDVKNLLSMMFTSITQGVLAAGASVYFNQIVKQAKIDE